MPLPPKSPELNPVENIWQFIRDNWLSNRFFQSYDDIVDHCCFAWNRLVDQPWTIMSIGLRTWAHRSCSARLGIRAPTPAWPRDADICATISHAIDTSSPVRH